MNLGSYQRFGVSGLHVPIVIAVSSIAIRVNYSSNKQIINTSVYIITCNLMSLNVINKGDIIKVGVKLGI